MKTPILLLISLASVALTAQPNECPDFDPYSDFTFTYGLTPTKIGSHIYFVQGDGPTWWRLTDATTGNLVSDSFLNSYYPNHTYYFQPLNLSGAQTTGQFVYLLDQQATPGFNGSYGFTCDQYGGEGILTVTDVPQGVNGTNWWLCPVPDDSNNRLALNFGVQQNDVPSGCKSIDLLGIQD